MAPSACRRARHRGGIRAGGTECASRRAHLLPTERESAHRAWQQWVYIRFKAWRSGVLTRLRQKGALTADEAASLEADAYNLYYFPFLRLFSMKQPTYCVGSATGRACPHTRTWQAPDSVDSHCQLDHQPPLEDVIRDLQRSFNGLDASGRVTWLKDEGNRSWLLHHLFGVSASARGTLPTVRVRCGISNHDPTHLREQAILYPCHHHHFIPRGRE